MFLFSSFYLCEKTHLRKKVPNFCQCAQGRRFTQVNVLEKRDYALVFLLETGFSSRDLRQGL